jgi:hypothetical protein
MRRGKQGDEPSFLYPQMSRICFPFECEMKLHGLICYRNVRADRVDSNLGETSFAERQTSPLNAEVLIEGTHCRWLRRILFCFFIGSYYFDPQVCPIHFTHTVQMSALKYGTLTS